MAPSSQTRKTVLLLISLTLLLATASAAELSVKDGTVWVNDTVERTEITVSGSGAANLTIQRPGGDEKTILTGNGSVTTSEFLGEVPDDPSLEIYKVRLYNNSSSETPEELEELSLKELSVNIEEEGSGYVTKKLGKPPHTDPLRLDLVLKEPSERVKISKESITRDNFNILSREARITDEKDVNAVQKGKKAEVTIHPRIVEAHPQEEKLILRIEYSHEGSKVRVRKKFNPKVFSLQGVPVGDQPPILMEYETLGSFSYNVDIFEDGRDTNPKLYSEDFKLVIKQRSKDWSEVLTDKKYLEVKQISGKDADYKLSLSSIPQLGTGTYRFTTKVKDPSTGDFTTIDSIRVRNGLRLAGRVVDSRNRGVKTEMTLKKSGSVRPISIGSNGVYSKKIEGAKGESTYDSVVMEFFDRGLPASDAKITVNSVDFAAGEGENLAGDSESIKFQYWDKPIVEKKAITPVNMMAVKFAYPIAETGHKASMKFNPENVNTDNLKVFECSSWNFEGRTCLGEWTEINQEGVTVNYQSMRANFPIDNPYLAENVEGKSKNILMNAYVIGTSADLELNGGLSITGPRSGRVATGSEIRVSGNINSENSKPVEGADVEISFYRGDEKVSSLGTVQTDITGHFVAKGNAPEEPGNYSVKLAADKENYNRLEKEFENRFETYLKEGISIETGSTIQVTPGEKKTAEVTVRNTGQTDMKDVSLTFSGMDSGFYSVSRSSFDKIPPGEERTSEVTISLPSDYCDNGCGDWPQLEIAGTATNPEGEKLEAETQSLRVQVNPDTSTSTESSDSETDKVSPETEDVNKSGSGFSESVSELENATGEFLASQSSLNLALGLIMVFLMILAGAVKKQKDGRGRSSRSGSRGSDGRSRGGGRPHVQKPNVSGSSEVKQVKPETPSQETSEAGEDDYEDEDVEDQIDEIADTVAAEEEDDTKVVEVDDEREEDGSGEAGDADNTEDSQKDIDSEVQQTGEKFVCEETGEEFDTRAALKLHRKINGLDD